MDVKTVYTDLMIDLETLGTVPGAAIISIGITAFNPVLPKEEWSTYACQPITYASNRSIGLELDESTVAWWSAQEPEAKVVFDAAMANEGKHIVEALSWLGDTYRLCDTYARAAESATEPINVWGNGSDFDNALLAVAYAKAGLKLPWSFRQNRCYRTAKKLLPWTELAFQGTKHDAAADSLHQAKCLVKALNAQAALRA
jgi:3' exoribonuclease, RNase T-like